VTNLIRSVGEAADVAGVVYRIQRCLLLLYGRKPQLGRSGA
jgi:hypothetical protein